MSRWLGAVKLEAAEGQQDNEATASAMTSQPYSVIAVLIMKYDKPFVSHDVTAIRIVFEFLKIEIGGSAQRSALKRERHADAERPLRQK